MAGARPAVGERELVLGRIRAALGRDRAAAGVPGAPNARPTDEREPELEGSAIPLFIERCREYGATVYEVEDGEVGETVREAMGVRGSASLVIPGGLPTPWYEAVPGAAIDTGFTATELDRFDCALTASAVAIAETGTIVLRADDRCGRRALSLIPDHHICVVDRNAILPTVAAAFARLGQGAERAPALTFISGPSATADIELKRVQGVHGPRKLDVIITGG